LPQTACQLVHHAIFPCAHFVEIDLRLGEFNPPIGGPARFADDFGNVQQRFRGNAAAIEANPTGIGFEVYERHSQAQVSRHKRRRVPARAGADNRHLCRIRQSVHI
jgi:hypothetical protein